MNTFKIFPMLLAATLAAVPAQASGFNWRGLVNEVISTLDKPGESAPENKGNSQSSGGPSSGNHIQSFFGAAKRPECRDVMRWTDHLTAAYPRSNSARGQNRNEVAKLFYDSQFVPVFGVPYDQLSGKERADLARSSITRCIADPCDDRTGRPTSLLRNTQRPSRDEALQKRQACEQSSGVTADNKWQLNAVLSAFTEVDTYARRPVGTPNPLSPATLAGSIATNRKNHAEVDRVLDEVSRLPATIAGFDQLKPLETVTEALVESFWPAEIRDARQKIADAKSRIAPAALDEAVSRAIADSSGQRDPGTLDALQQERVGLFKLAGSDEAQRQVARLDARRGEILAPVLAEERKLMQRGEGLAFLSDGARWYRDVFKRRYLDPYPGLPPVRELNEYFETKRLAALDSSMDQLMGLMKKSRSRSEALALFEQYVPLELDWRDLRHADTLLAFILNREGEALLGFRGLDGLEMSAKWHAGLTQDYSRFAKRPAYDELEKKFWLKRDELIQTSRQDLFNLAGRAEHESVIESLIKRYLPMEEGRKHGIIADMDRAVVDAQDRRAEQNAMPTRYDVLHAVSRYLASALPGAAQSFKPWGYVKVTRSFAVQLSVSDLSCSRKGAEYLCQFTVGDSGIALPPPDAYSNTPLWGAFNGMNQSSVMATLGRQDQKYLFKWGSRQLNSEQMEEDYKGGYKKYDQALANSINSARQNFEDSRCLRGFYTRGEMATALTFGGKLCP